MGTDWFKGCLSVQDVRTRYHELAMRWHPDRAGGNTQTMQSINAAYERELAERDGETSQGDDDREHTYHYNAERERMVMYKVSELLKLAMVDVTIRIIGTWVWAVGSTRPYKESLKELGFKFIGARVAWAWHNGVYYKSKASNASLDDLQGFFGGRDVAGRTSGREMV